VSDTVKCTLCPADCRLENFQVGACRARMNREGKLITLVYGRVCAVHVDPIEKKPIFHMLPGSGAFSIATPGCNLTCRFCQNWGISQAAPEKIRTEELPPEEVVRRAVGKGCRSVAYTYTEPSIYYEYMLDTARRAKEAGLRNVWVTAAYINRKPLEQLIPFIDAANIDLKAFDEAFYRDICGGKLKPVLEAIELTVSRGVLVELTNLVVPTHNDSDRMLTDLCRWVIRTLGPDVPLHFSRFYPQYKMDNLPPTPVETIGRAYDIARAEGINYVYTGNVPHDGRSDTCCPGCGGRLVGRVGYRVTHNALVGGACPTCRRTIPGVWS
jgi:pyruvate formate lyase activating enzyme